MVKVNIMKLEKHRKYKIWKLGTVGIYFRFRVTRAKKKWPATE